MRKTTRLILKCLYGLMALVVIFCANLSASICLSRQIVNDVITRGMSAEVKADELHAYVLSHFKYEKDRIEWWQSPIQTIIRGKGDCEDLATLEWFLFRCAGLDASLVVGKLNGYGHAWVECEGLIWDSTIRDIVIVGDTPSTICSKTSNVGSKIIAGMSYVSSITWVAVPIPPDEADYMSVLSFNLEFPFWRRR